MRSAALALLAAALLSGCGGAASPTDSAPRDAEAGGEKSIERFGSEAAGAPRAAILAAFHGYLGGLGRRDYRAACFRLSALARHSLERLAAPSPKRLGCAQLLPAVLAPTAAPISRQQAGGEVRNVRAQGERAFVVFHAPGARLYQMLLVEDHARWKVATVAAAILLPSPSMFAR
jgi:hypothetical protein